MANENRNIVKGNSKGKNAKRPRGKQNPRDRKPKKDDYTRDDRMGAEEVNHKYNDVSWYVKNEAMLRDAASFSYNTPLGDPLPQLFENESQQLYTIPGVYYWWFEPTIGVSNSSTSPANLAAQNIYSYVRYMNSGAKNYDQADLMLYLVAMDSVYMMWNYLKRIYGYARTYSQKNKYMPRAYAYIDGIDFDHLISNLADLRLSLNQLAARISSFCVPAVMPIFIRHSWMVSNIYKDSDNDKAQQYYLRPGHYFVYDETGSTFGGQIMPKDLPIVGANVKYNNIIAAITEMLDAIGYSEDIGVMSGDILKAYGQEKLFKISPVMPDYEVIPVYNEEVLNQLHNSTVVEGYTPTPITQDPNTGFLIWDPELSITGDFPIVTRSRAMINMPWDEVKPSDTMVATRLTSMVTFTGATGSKKGRIDCCGSEILVAARIVKMSTANPGTFNYRIVPNVIQITSGGNAGDNTSKIQLIRDLTNFDWHPLTPISEVYQSGDPAKWQQVMHGLLGDINNYTFIDIWSMAQLHQTALLSEFNVPQIGSF